MIALPSDESTGEATNGGPQTGILVLGIDGPREDLVERERERDLFPFPFPFSCYRSITVLRPFLCPFPGTDCLYLRDHFYIKNLLFQIKNLVDIEYIYESKNIKIL